MTATAPTAMGIWRRVFRRRYRRQRVPNGLILYEGPSAIDGTPIVVIATGTGMASRNRKTGDLIAIYVLLQDVAPLVAVKDGQDLAVCGDCPHRPSTGGKCYVLVHQAVTKVWQACQAGRYPRAMPGDLDGAALRITAWGDASAVPLAVWLPLVKGSVHHVGYTSRWRELGEGWRFLMASVSSPREAFEASNQGWRTYRMVDDVDDAIPGEVECRNTSDGITCAECRGCDGIRRSAYFPGFRIAVHGHGQ